MNGMTPAPDLQQKPPINYEAEQALLGAILVDNRAYDDVAPFLKAQHFAHPNHADIFAACATLIEQGKKANGTTLLAVFRNDATMTALGGAGYLAGLMGAATSPRNAIDYGRVILDLAKRRAAMGAAEQLIAEAMDVRPDGSAQELLHQHGKAVDDILAEGEVGSGLIGLSAGIDEAMIRTDAAIKSDTKLTGVPTGLRDLDRKTGGFQPGNLIILGARPSMGKTTLALSMMRGAAEAGHGVAFFSLEMSKEEVSWVLLANLSGIPAEAQRGGRIDSQQYLLVSQAARRLRELPVLIDDTPAQPVAALRAKARQLKRRGKLGIIFVDYLGLMRPEGRGSGNRVEDVSQMSAGLKAMAKEMQVPVVALSQLNRAVEGRENKKPILADLRESGSIEQDADVVMFLYRDEYYLSREKPGASAKPEVRAAWEDALEASQNVAELILPKVRMGQTGSVKLSCDLAKSRFFDFDHQTTARQEEIPL